MTTLSIITIALALFAITLTSYNLYRLRRPHTGAALVVPDSPKMLRETLCVAQARIGNSPLDADRREEHMSRLGRLIAECDRHRPLGPDGKHGDRHTPTCGCDDTAGGAR